MATPHFRVHTVALTAAAAVVVMSGAAFAARSIGGSADGPAAGRPSHALVMLDLAKVGPSMHAAGFAVGFFYQVAIPTSNDPNLVPVRPGISAATLAPSDKYIASAQAIGAAESSFGVKDTNVVRAVEVSMTSDDGFASHSGEPAWVVVADYSTPTPVGIGSWNQLCIVVDAVTGAYQYAYPTDLSTGAQAAAVRYLKHTRARYKGKRGVLGAP